MLVKSLLHIMFLVSNTYHFQWIMWHPKGNLILAGSEDSSIWMWNADKAACLNVFVGHESSVTCGNFTPDGIFLFLSVSIWCICG